MIEEIQRPTPNPESRFRDSMFGVRCSMFLFEQEHDQDCAMRAWSFVRHS